MYAWLCEDPTGVDSLRWCERPKPQPAAGEVGIEVHAASLNFPDLLTVQNKYQIKPPLPFVPGSEFSGTVQAVGDGVRHVKPGDAVASIGAAGGFATHACVPASQVIALPPGFNLDDGAAFAFTYGTSHHALIDRAALRSGETVLVLGAAGGVGSAAVQIAKAAGARVIAAVSSADKAAFCTELGADMSIDLSHQDLRGALKAAQVSPDVVLDPVGGDLAEAAFRSIAWRGRYLVIGFAAGPIPALPLNLALLKGLVRARRRETSHRYQAADDLPARGLRAHGVQTLTRQVAGRQPPDMTTPRRHMQSRQPPLACSCDQHIALRSAWLMKGGNDDGQSIDPRRQPGGACVPLPRRARQLQRCHRHHRSR
jgi:NADPH:quinone reductase